MKFSFSLIEALVSAIPAVLALPEPAPVAAAKPEETVYPFPIKRGEDINALEARGRVAGTVQVDGLRYRTCPRTTCTTIGTYSKGDPIIINCYTRTDTTVIEGDAGWALLETGYYVALAGGKYVSWSGSINTC